MLNENPAMIEIPLGGSRGCLTVTILSSIVVEHDEEIQFGINNTVLAVVEDATTAVFIQKDGGSYIHMAANIPPNLISLLCCVAVVTLGFEYEFYKVIEDGLLEVVVFKSLPCDFDILFRVHAEGIIDEELVLKAAENETIISVTLPDDEVALEPDENHMLILSLSVPDPQVELGTHISILTIADDDSKSVPKSCCL